MSSNESQIGGAHYKTAYQPWDFTLDVFGGCFFLGNANKYITRWRKKNGVEDLQKARHYIVKVQECYATSRLAPPRQLGEEALAAILKHYSMANQLGFLETDILAALALGRFDLALEYIDRLIQEAQA